MEQSERSWSVSTNGNNLLHGLPHQYRLKPLNQLNRWKLPNRLKPRGLSPWRDAALGRGRPVCSGMGPFDRRFLGAKLSSQSCPPRGRSRYRKFRGLRESCLSLTARLSTGCQANSGTVQHFDPLSKRLEQSQCGSPLAERQSYSANSVYVAESTTS
jgi:hypothetical protein